MNKQSVFQNTLKKRGFCMKTELVNDGVHELVYLTLLNDQDAFVHLKKRMAPLIRRCYNTFGLSRLIEWEDWDAKSMELLHKAVLYYQDRKHVTFPTCYYHFLCNRARDICRRSQSKGKGDAGYIRSLDACALEDAAGPAIAEITPDPRVNVHEQVVTAMLLDQVKAILQKQLPDGEYRVIELFLEGRSITEIARIINRSKTFVYGVMERARRLCRCIDTPFH